MLYGSTSCIQMFKFFSSHSANHKKYLGKTLQVTAAVAGGVLVLWAVESIGDSPQQKAAKAAEQVRHLAENEAKAKLENDIRKRRELVAEMDFKRALGPVRCTLTQRFYLDQVQGQAGEDLKKLGMNTGDIASYIEVVLQALNSDRFFTYKSTRNRLGLEQTPEMYGDLDKEYGYMRDSASECLAEYVDGKRVAYLNNTDIIVHFKKK